MWSLIIRELQKANGNWGQDYVTSTFFQWLQSHSNYLVKKLEDKSYDTRINGSPHRVTCCKGW